MKADTWLTGRPGQMLAVAIGLVALCVLWLGVIDPIRGWFDDRQFVLEQRRALLHHMTELAASLPALRAASTDKRDDSTARTTIALTGTSDAIAAADLQERVQTMASSAGASLNAVETLPPSAATGGWHKIALRINLNASWPVLVDLVGAIKRSPTHIFIDDVHFHSPVLIVRRTAPPIQASMVLYGFRPADAATGS